MKAGSGGIGGSQQIWALWRRQRVLWRRVAGDRGGGIDKSAAFRQILEAAKVHHSNSSFARSTGPVVFIGDSPSDLLPMLEADIGIIIGTNPRLREIAKFGGVCIRPLCAGGMPSAF